MITCNQKYTLFLQIKMCRVVIHAMFEIKKVEQKLGIPKIQFTYQMKLKKNEDQSMDLLRRGNKIPMVGDTETKCGEKTEEKAIQRLPPPGDPSHIQSPNLDTLVDAN